MSKIGFAMSKMLFKTKCRVKKGAPSILLVAGIIGVVGGTVMACKATTKLSTIQDEYKEEIAKIDAKEAEIDETAEEQEYTVEDAKNDRRIVKVHAGLKVVRLYLPAAAVTVASVICLASSHRIMIQRNAGLTAAYAALDEAFRDYRKGVVDRYGKDVDHQIKHHIRKEEIEETIVDPNTGETTTAKKEVDTVDETFPEHSIYARFFDESCDGWTKSPETNFLTCRSVQAECNSIMKIRYSHSGFGYLFLNEAYAKLGIPPTKAGQVVGWIYDPVHPNGDNYIDFGLYDIHDPAKRRFVNGLERNILLDFNVDGNIWDKMDAYVKEH